MGFKSTLSTSLCLLWTLPIGPCAFGQTPEIRTPPAPATPRINGPSRFGVTPGAPLLYTIPATGERPMSFAAEGLPEGVSLDAASGRLTGVIKQAGEFSAILRAKNARGATEKRLLLCCGERIALTPPMGWNSWNCWAQAVTQERVLHSARALIASGLAQHGWCYVNIDDTWQGKRDPKTLALQGNERFPDLGRLCEDIHALGLKAGIYSSPWITTYGGFPGGSSDDPSGAWQSLPNNDVNKRFGKFAFASQDARQWATWGFDYLKYDWDPNDVPHTREMALALRATGRDMVFSLSNTAPIASAPEFAKWAQCWRTTGDLWDTWETPGPWQHSVTEIGFNQDAWTPFAGPGHFNDPDMLVLGWVGWGPSLHQTHLTAAEQYSHFTLWCMLGAPLLIGCDLERLDPFTLGLLSNDEVIALDQDALGRQGQRVATLGAIDVYRKDLEDGSCALAFFNRGDVAHAATVKLERLGRGGAQRVRDLWRQQDRTEVTGDLPVVVEAHDVQLYRLTAATAKR